MTAPKPQQPEQPRLFAEAQQLQKQNQVEKALLLYQQFLNESIQEQQPKQPATSAASDQWKYREQALLNVGQLLRDLARPQEMAQLVRSCQQALNQWPKAKTTKIVRQLIDYFSDIPNSIALQVQVCQDLIQWSVQDNRLYLQQALETRLVALYLDNRMYTEALQLIGTLLRQLKKLDDKLVLVEVHLLESRCYHALKNLPKARAALTSARTNANAVYTPPALQTSLDLQSGVLYAEEGDYRTAYSYFYETFEGYNSMDDARAVMALKYMLLCQIMSLQVEDVHSLVSGKLALKHRGPELDAMKSVALAYEHRSLEEFEKALSSYPKELQQDPILKNHLAKLYDTLLEQNLTRVMEPYSRVEIAHLASLVHLPPKKVEEKLSQMILDGLVRGVLDQAAGTLVVFEEVANDKTYDKAMETVKSMAHVVDSLYEKARRL